MKFWFKINEDMGFSFFDQINILAGICLETSFCGFTAYYLEMDESLEYVLIESECPIDLVLDMGGVIEKKLNEGSDYPDYFYEDKQS